MEDAHTNRQPLGQKPIGIKWRASYWFTTFVVGSGIAIDLLVYSIIIPVIPFHLEHLGCTGVSALTGWLLFAYSGGLVTSTIPIAMLSESYNLRRWPLIIGFLILIGSQIMLMEAPIYAVMCIARVLQGIGSSMVWVVGLALLCDAAPEGLVGQQLGIAMVGFSIGLTLGSPVGGALYTHFGYRGPFVFGIVAAFLDLIGRLVIIERKDAIKWGYDPRQVSAAAASSGDASVEHKQQRDIDQEKFTGVTCSMSEPLETPVGNQKSLPLVTVLVKLSKSSRAVTASMITLFYGIVYSSQEPSIPLHLQRVWKLSSGSVGLVFIAGVVPTLFSSPITGHYADKHGPEWVTSLCLLLALPWWGIVIIQHRLALFVVAFAVQSLFTSGVVSPLLAELAAVSRGIDGVGYAHVYGAFNLAYGIGTAIGPIIGGQMYDRLRYGWKALCLFATGLVALSLLLAYCFIGERPLRKRHWWGAKYDATTQITPT